MKSLAKALDILNYMAVRRDEVRLSDIAEGLGIGKSTVSKMLSVLARYDYVQKSPDTGKFRLGAQYIRVGSQLLRQMSVPDAAKPLMAELARQTGETVNLMLPYDTRGIFVHIIESNQLNRTFRGVGTVEYLHACSCGKAILAYLAPAERERILAAAGMPALTPRTVVDRVALEDQLAAVRQEGYAVEQEEICLGACCVAAPILDFSGAPVAAVSISAPLSRMPKETVCQYGELVAQACGRISGSLGHFQKPRV